ncbi:MAG: DUF1565 domain-containing protein [Nostocaceae cyanobacterium]|nr:DUF1565 domain-containing protein [Nostocaceae cyanobacterium]
MNSLHFFKHLRADILPVVPVSKVNKSYLFLEIAMFFIWRYLVLLLTVSGALTMAWVSTSQKAAIAQVRSTQESISQGIKTPSQVKVLFVNPTTGNDSGGDGSERTPLKTITQALKVAESNTTIVLAQGTYSADTGETFPLTLKPGVTIQGDPNSKGRGIIITGGGNYLSRFFGSKHITIVGANQAKLTGVTVTNPNNRGYGLWIESTNPIVTENTFADSTQDGIAVTGKAKPNISNNDFYRNGANGITISANASPQIRSNVFQQTGFGINVANNAQPIIVDNTIRYNRSGIIVQASSRPVLRSNIIQKNTEDGLVVISKAMPDLGNSSEPGSNQFSDNGRYEINASAAKEMIYAYGNNLKRHRVSGEIDFSGTAPAFIPEDSQEDITPSASLRDSKPSNNNLSRGQSRRQMLPVQTPVISQQSNPKRSIPTGKSGFPMPSSLTPQSNRRTEISDSSQVNGVQADSSIIEFVAPQSSSQFLGTSATTVEDTNSQSSLPILEAASLDESGILTTPGGNSPRRVAQSNFNVINNNYRYRVIATVVTQRDREIVKFLAPDAFPTFSGGQTVMQAGVFNSRDNADNMVRILTNNGLQATVEQIGN